MNGACRRISEPVQPACRTIRPTIGIGPIIQIRPHWIERTFQGMNSMTAKLAVALIATTMFVAPALAADNANSAAPAAPANSATAPASPAASTPAKSTNTAGKPAAAADTKSRTAEVVHRHARHTMLAHNGKNHMKTATVTRTVKVTKSNQSAWPFGPFTWTAPSKSEHSVKVVHHHVHHTMVAHGGKPSGEAKTVQGEKPVKTEVKRIAQAPAASASPPASTTAKSDAGKADTSKTDVKVIKANKDLKNGGKPGKPDATQGQAAPGAGAPAGTSNKDNSKTN
jgi:hypothetical protein